MTEEQTPQGNREPLMHVNCTLMLFVIDLARACVGRIARGKGLVVPPGCKNICSFHSGVFVALISHTSLNRRSLCSSTHLEQILHTGRFTRGSCAWVHIQRFYTQVLADRSLLHIRRCTEVLLHKPNCAVPSESGIGKMDPGRLKNVEASRPNQMQCLFQDVDADASSGIGTAFHSFFEAETGTVLKFRIQGG